MILDFLAAVAAVQAPPPSTACDYDRASMMALGQPAFDQDMDGGWRAVARRPGCELAAADLVRDYRATHRLADTILYWHEGQLRASAGQETAAIALFERSRKQPDDGFGWNFYVDATIAFLRDDRPGLMAAREALARLPRPIDFDPRDPQGRPLEIAWPLNLDIVDRLVACFGGTYRETYSGNCGRAGVPPPG